MVNKSKLTLVTTHSKYSYLINIIQDLIQKSYLPNNSKFVVFVYRYHDINAGYKECSPHKKQHYYCFFINLGTLTLKYDELEAILAHEVGHAVFDYTMVHKKDLAGKKANRYMSISCDVILCFFIILLSYLFLPIFFQFSIHLIILLTLSILTSISIIMVFNVYFRQSERFADFDASKLIGKNKYLYFIKKTYQNTLPFQNHLANLKTKPFYSWQYWLYVIYKLFIHMDPHGNPKKRIDRIESQS